MNPIGIYEKALPSGLSWPALMRRGRALGFDFLEIAIDESEERLARLHWSEAEKVAFFRAALEEHLHVRCLIFSVLRKVPLGAPDPTVRAEAIELLKRGIAFAAETGIRCLQLPGYYSFYVAAGADGAARYTQALSEACAPAAAAGVMLAIENMDGDDITDIAAALRHVRAVGSPWLRLYPDLGNLAGNGRDVVQEITLAAGQMVGVHVKDARPGQYRRVPFGTGCVPFAAAFAALAATGYDGPLLIEMWNDDAEDSDKRAREALAFVRRHIGAAYAREPQGQR